MNDDGQLICFKHPAAISDVMPQNTVSTSDTRSSTILVNPLPAVRPSSSPPAHHVGSPPPSFINPWPSFRQDNSLFQALRMRFSAQRNFVPVPDSRDELVPIRRPDWGFGHHGLKVTWIGHASFLVETACTPGKSRGVRILLDPVFSERMSPVGFLGPKRFSPPPCSIEELPEVDLVLISHDHYDHLDMDTVRRLYQRHRGQMHFFCPLGIKTWFHGIAVGQEDVTELDWFHGVRVDVAEVGSVDLVCAPAQHFSGRSPLNLGKTLWCSWVIIEPGQENSSKSRLSEGDSHEKQVPLGRRLYFSGDTGYRTVTESDCNTDLATLPFCPAFSEIGNTFGPFDLALLPIGCCTPRTFMSSVHCSPEDSICIHKDICSKRSIGMHYGTVRGGISSQFEDVRDPPKWWKAACEKGGLVWGKDIDLCDIGETVIVDYALLPTFYELETSLQCPNQSPHRYILNSKLNLFWSVMAAPPHSQSQSPLLCLPFEIRKMIWEEVFGGMILHIVLNQSKMRYATCRGPDAACTFCDRGDEAIHYEPYGTGKGDPAKDKPMNYLKRRWDLYAVYGNLLVLPMTCRFLERRIHRIRKEETIRRRLANTDIGTTGSYPETISNLYSSPTFIFSHAQTLQFFRSQTPARHWSLIRRVQIYWHLNLMLYYSLRDDDEWFTVCHLVNSISDLRCFTVFANHSRADISAMHVVKMFRPLKDLNGTWELKFENDSRTAKTDAGTETLVKALKMISLNNFCISYY